MVEEGRIEAPGDPGGFQIREPPPADLPGDPDDRPPPNWPDDDDTDETDRGAR